MFALPIGFIASYATAGTPLLLDSISATVAGAWGMRMMRAAYGWACLRVRRTSDNAEQDIGFASGSLDTTALTTFCGSNSGAVSKWYDQSGNSQDLGNPFAANQPFIVVAGVVQTLNNATARPAWMANAAAGQSLYRSGFSLGGSAYSASLVAAKTTSVSTYGRLAAFTKAGEDDYASTSSVIFGYKNGGNMTGYQAGDKSSVAFPGTSPFQLTSVWSGTAHVLSLDATTGSGVAASGTLAATGALSIGSGSGPAGGPTDFWDGPISAALITYGALSSADQTTIRASQRAHYGTS